MTATAIALTGAEGFPFLTKPLPNNHRVRQSNPKNTVFGTREWMAENVDTDLRRNMLKALDNVIHGALNNSLTPLGYRFECRKEDHDWVFCQITRADIHELRQEGDMDIEIRELAEGDREESFSLFYERRREVVGIVTFALVSNADAN